MLVQWTSKYVHFTYKTCLLGTDTLLVFEVTEVYYFVEFTLFTIDFKKISKCLKNVESLT